MSHTAVQKVNLGKALEYFMDTHTQKLVLT